MKSFNVNHCDTFNTPDHVFNQLDSVFNFNYDGACSSINMKCEVGSCIDLGVDGLKERWEDKRVFCNPPFSEKARWIEKAHYEVKYNRCPIVVMILPLNCMSTSSFQDNVISQGYCYEIPAQRIQFLNDETKKPVNGNNSGTVIVYFKKKLSVKAEVEYPDKELK